MFCQTMSVLSDLALLSISFKAGCTSSIGLSVFTLSFISASPVVDDSCLMSGGLASSPEESLMQLRVQALEPLAKGTNENSYLKKRKDTVRDL